jgi:hypothetical protein
MTRKSPATCSIRYINLNVAKKYPPGITPSLPSPLEGEG